MNRILRVLCVGCLFFLIRSSVDSEFKHLQIDCSIYDLSGSVIRTYNATLCVFFEDGARVEMRDANNERSIDYISQSGEVIWSFKDLPHHDLQVTADKKRIYYLGSEYAIVDNKNVRFDTLNIRSIAGKLIAKWSFKSNLNILKKILTDHNRPFQFFLFGRQHPFNKFEIGHFNSFKEIPSNNMYPKLKYLKPGNFILGANCLGLFIIFNHNLKKIEKTIDYNNKNDCNTHDVQVLPNGNILNFSNHEAGEIKSRSFIKELDVFNKTVVWTWPRYSDYAFSHRLLGSIQRLPNGDVLTIDYAKNSQEKAKVLKINSNGKIVEKWLLNHSEEARIYRARLLNLDKFLENSI